MEKFFEKPELNQVMELVHVRSFLAPVCHKILNSRGKVIRNAKGNASE